jgi:hypothetical protein
LDQPGNNRYFRRRVNQRAFSYFPHTCWKHDGNARMDGVCLHSNRGITPSFELETLCIIFPRTLGVHRRNGLPARIRWTPAYPRAQRPDLVMRFLDTNHDGIIDAGEMADAAKKIKSLDANNDGKITLAELRAIWEHPK